VVHLLIEICNTCILINILPSSKMRHPSSFLLYLLSAKVPTRICYFETVKHNASVVNTIPPSQLKPPSKLTSDQPPKQTRADEGKTTAPVSKQGTKGLSKESSPCAAQTHSISRIARWQWMVAHPPLKEVRSDRGEPELATLWAATERQRRPCSPSPVPTTSSALPPICSPLFIL